MPSSGRNFFQDVFNAETAQRGVWLDDLYVREPARRQGIGQDLIAAVARETLARRGRALWWSVFRDNRGARAFYGKLGAHDNDADVVELELDGEALTALCRAATN